MDYLQNVNSSSQRRDAATPRQFHVVIHKTSVGRKAWIDVPRLDSFIHYQMIQAAIVFHRVCLDLYSPEPGIPTILNQ